MTNLMVDEIDAEIWDRSVEDADADLLDMAITIYRGASDSEEYKSFSITQEEATAITGKKPKKLLGFTEWNTAGGLLFMNLPWRVDEWVVEVTAEYTGIPADQIKSVRSMSLVIARVIVEERE